MNKAFSFASLFFLVVSTFAIRALAQVPQESYYETLKKKYQVASSLVTFQDINVPGHPLNKVCVEFDEDKPFAANYVLLEKYEKTLLGEGPLLGEAHLMKVFYTRINPVSPPSTFYIDMTNTELVPSGKEIVTWLVNFDGKRAWTVSIKKLDDSLIFKREVQVAQRNEDGNDPVVISQTKISYGYCYPR